MNKALFNELLQSVKESAAIERGEQKPSRTFDLQTGTDVDPLLVSLVGTGPFSTPLLRSSRWAREHCFHNLAAH